MKRSLSALFILCVLTLALAAPCPTAAMAADDQPIPVAVSILPQKYFLEQIGGGLLDVSVMVAPGASPATYEPRPQQMAALAKTKAYFAIGVPFEAAWLPRFAAANADLRVIRTDERVKKIPMAAHHHHDEGEMHEHEGEEHHHEGEVHEHEGEEHHDEGEMHEHEAEHEHEHGTLDPHIWLDPGSVAFQVLSAAEGLAEIDPAHAKEYRSNAGSFVGELAALDQDIRNILKDIPPQNRKFLVFHPSWGYFAKTYGLEQVPMEVQGKEPSPKEMEALVKEAKAEKIKVVFVQPQFSDKSANTLAEQIGALVVKLDPLAENWADNLIQAAQSFSQALQ